MYLLISYFSKIKEQFKLPKISIGISLFLFADPRTKHNTIGISLFTLAYPRSRKKVRFQIPWLSAIMTAYLPHVLSCTLTTNKAYRYAQMSSSSRLTTLAIISYPHQVFWIWNCPTSYRFTRARCFELSS